MPTRNSHGIVDVQVCDSAFSGGVWKLDVKSAVSRRNRIAHAVQGSINPMIETDRLVLRQWRDDDFPAFARLCDDEEVMEFFPKRLTQDESDAMGQRIKSLIAQRGWGCWAVEVPGESHFIGFVGLHIPNASLPFSPCVEIGWRLAKPYWGRGYATEAANASLRYAFTQLDLDEVVSFTTLHNVRSQAVMEKLGMRYTSNFSHPDLEPSNPLCEHVLYKISKCQWQASVNATSVGSQGVNGHLF